MLNFIRSSERSVLNSLNHAHSVWSLAVLNSLRSYNCTDKKRSQQFIIQLTSVAVFWLSAGKNLGRRQKVIAFKIIDYCFHCWFYWLLKVLAWQKSFWGAGASPCSRKPVLP